MELKRFKDIIAIKTYDSVTRSDTFVALHGKNLEVAEVSLELFEEMTEVSILSGEIPPTKDTLDDDAHSALINWNNEQNIEVKDGKIEFGIRSITINVNQICNLKCAYCAAGGDGTYGEPANQISVEKTLPQLKYFLSSLKENSKFSIVFVGGEPLLHPKAVLAIYEYVTAESKEYGVSPLFSIVTNGTLLRGETLNILRSMKLYLTISIDAVKEVNDIVRPTKNGHSSTDMTLVGIEALSEDRGNILSIGFASVHSIDNENLIANYQFLKQLNPDWIEFNYAYAEKSIESQKKYLEQMSQIAQQAWDHGGEKELRKIKNFDEYFSKFDSQRRIENHCGAGKSYLMVDAKNKLYTCPWVVGDKDEIVGQGEQLDHNKLSKYSKPLIELNNCTSCWAKYLCGGGCMYINKTHTGDKHSKDILFCERTRSLILITLLYYKRARNADL
jgi:uncharacterized protein